MESVLQQNLTALYGEQAPAQHQRYQKVRDRFAQVFTGEPHMFVSAPGRSELGGNHTDHQQGCVLTAAVDLDMAAAVRKIPGETVCIHSLGYAPFAVDLRRLTPDPGERGAPASLVRGVAARMAELGYRIGGFQAAVASDVLPGSGLSSSAAFEVLMGAIFNRLYNHDSIVPSQLAKIAQYAEKEFFGKPCGLQDQMACALGGVAHIDFKDAAQPEYTKIPFQLESMGYALCITGTGAGHAGLTGEYAAIPREMQCVARRLGRPRLRGCDEEAFFARLPELRTACGDRAVLRAYHFFMEDKRPERMAEALLAADFPAFLALVNESGRSSNMYLQNIHVAGETREQALGVALALSERLLAGRGAFRVHGGGFAGTIQAYVPWDLLRAYRDGMDAVFGAGSCRALRFRDAGPVCLDVE